MNRHISALMLERYRLGEITEEESKLVEDELASNPILRSRCESLDESDRELRRLYPRLPERNMFHKRGFMLSLCAAALLVCMLVPAVYLMRGYLTKVPLMISSVDVSGPDRLK